VPRIDLIAEAERQMVICNACRYCEGYCAVFPAMELRTTFNASDLVYLANLCHDCRACLYACQYAPPHAFNVNVPQVLADIRTDTYADYTWPAIFAGIRSSMLATTLLVLACLVSLGGFVFSLGGKDVFVTPETGEGAFYRVVPYMAMVAPAIVILGYAVVVFCFGIVRFWRDTSSGSRGGLTLTTLLQALRDAFALRYMKGGGDGCNYPDERFSKSRRVFHHLTYYGFLLDLAATTIAAYYEHFLGWTAPYPLLSWPVVLGTVGGVMLLIGTSGLLWLKAKSDRQAAGRLMFRMDVIFLVMLNLTALSGLILLVMRETSAMAGLLILHLAIVAGLFLTLPYGKFAHAVYRTGALVRNAVEQAAPRRQSAH
jgi:citrate/tricarballylate utilization protein